MFKSQKMSTPIFIPTDIKINGLQDYMIEHILYDLDTLKTAETVKCLQKYELSTMHIQHISRNYLKYNDLLKCEITMQQCIDEPYLTNYTTNMTTLFSRGITLEYLNKLENKRPSNDNVNGNKNIKLFLIQNYTNLVRLMDDHILNIKNIVDINNMDSRLFKMLIDNYSDVLVYLNIFTMNEILAKYLVIIKNRC